jgi:hypothetical protein
LGELPRGSWLLSKAHPSDGAFDFPIGFTSARIGVNWGGLTTAPEKKSYGSQKNERVIGLMAGRPLFSSQAQMWVGFSRQHVPMAR